jgi:hypothetical protein
MNENVVVIIDDVDNNNDYGRTITKLHNTCKEYSCS